MIVVDHIVKGIGELVGRMVVMHAGRKIAEAGPSR